MSDSDRPRGSHGGSSLSIFSGVATSSAGSGTSDLDHINVEELSEASLQDTLEEAQRQIRRLTLETNMFQGDLQLKRAVKSQLLRARFCLFTGYCERLLTGQMDFKWNGEDRMGKRSSMKSNLSMTSDSTPESESCRTSLADISHGGGSRASRRRSGSRTSRGSRGKTLRLTIEHKLGISKKEQF